MKTFVKTSYMAQPKIQTVCAFTIMVFWLYVFPLSGQMIADGNLLKWFMLTSAATFWILAHIDTRYLSKPLKWTAVLTLSFLGFIFLDIPPAYCPPALLVLGVCSATISAFVGTTLSKETLIYAVIGIVLGNLLSYIPGLLGLSKHTTIYLASVANLSLLLLNLQTHFDDKPPQSGKHFGNQFGIPSVFYLFPFVLFFETLAGIMYSQIWPVYLSSQAAFQGIELIPYITALFMGYVILNKSLLLNFILAVLAAIVSFVIWFYAEQSLYTVYALCFMIFAAGFIDVAIIFSVARAEETFRAYVLLQGSVLFGISLGNFVFSQQPISNEQLSLIGLLIVNISLISLFLLHYRFGHRFNQQQATASTANTVNTVTAKSTIDSDSAVEHPAPIPEAVEALLLTQLSEQEYRVIKHVLLGNTYKDVANELHLSESTVKTYMQRIYKKLDVYNLNGLKHKLKI